MTQVGERFISASRSSRRTSESLGLIVRAGSVRRAGETGQRGRQSHAYMSHDWGQLDQNIVPGHERIHDSLGTNPAFTGSLDLSAYYMLLKYIFTYIHNIHNIYIY